MRLGSETIAIAAGDAHYEIKDGAPNLVNFEVHDGTYVVPKVLERGYLAVGQQRLAFERA